MSDMKPYVSPPWPMYEPDFEEHPLLHAEWLRVCDGQPMSNMDNARYQLDPPPAQKVPPAAPSAPTTQSAEIDSDED